MHNGILYFCDQCDYKPKVKVKVKYHKLNVHEGKTYKCLECTGSYPSPDDLRQHTKNVHQQDQLYCKAKDCNFKGESIRKTIKHRQEVHGHRIKMMK